MCDICEKEYDFKEIKGLKFSMDKDGDLLIENDELGLVLYIPINYCPFCGKEIERK